MPKQWQDHSYTKT